jgi:hypothetical protein
VNDHASLDVIVNYGKTTEASIDDCLRRRPAGDKFKKSRDDSNEKGDISHSITWTNETAAGDYEIYLSGDRDSDGDLSNYLSIEWRGK